MKAIRQTPIRTLTQKMFQKGLFAFTQPSLAHPATARGEDERGLLPVRAVAGPRDAGDGFDLVGEAVEPELPDALVERAAVGQA